MATTTNVQASLELALEALARMKVAGIQRSYGPRETPPVLSRAQLPARIVFLGVDDVNRERFGAFKMHSPSGDVAVVTHLVTDLLVYRPYGLGMGFRSHQAGIALLLEAYADALRQDPKLGELLFRSAVVSEYVSPVKWAGVQYYGARLWHTWEFRSGEDT